MSAVEAAVRHDTQLRIRYATTALGLLVILVIVAAVRGPSLFTGDGLTLAFAVAAPLVLAAMAITPIAVAGRGGVDLSIGPLMGFVNVVIVQYLIIEAGVSGAWAIVPVALAIGVAVQLVQGAMVAIVRLQPVVVTLAGFLVLEGLNHTILPQASGAIPAWFTRLASDVGGFPTALIVLIGVWTLWALVARSTLYRNVRLLGANESAAYASGLPIVRAHLAAFVLSGLLAGTAGLMLTAILGTGDPDQGSVYTLSAVTALVLGGTSLAGGVGGMLGSAVAAFDVYLVTYILGTFDFGKYASFVNELTYGLILIVALILGATVVRMTRRRAVG